MQLRAVESRVRSPMHLFVISNFLLERKNDDGKIMTSYTVLLQNAKKNKFSLSTPALMAFTFGLKLRTFATFLIILFCRQSIFFSRLVISAANFVLKATNLQKMPFYLWHANIFFDCKSFPCLENFLVTLMAVYRVVG